jgi:nucleoside 2-deoxyribosyltransferase
MPGKELNAFLSTPYGKTDAERVYWKALASAIRDIAKAFREPSVNVVSAEDEVNALVLKENVSRLIDKCDFSIAITTGKNPNIFWEIGYTEAQKKPVVYLVDRDSDDLNNSPVLVIEALKCPYRAKDLVNIVENKKIPDDMAIRLRKFIEQAVRAVKDRPKPPKLAAFSVREECHLPDLVEKADHRIYLITSNISYFADFDNFTVDKNDQKVFAFDPPVERGVDVKILTMDPESPIVKYRAEQLTFEYDVGTYREELRDSARRFYQRYKDRRNVTIRLYDDLPLQITLMVDYQVMTSVMSRGSRSRKNLHFLLDMNLPGAQNSFEAHFSEVSAGPCKHISTFKWAGQS